MIEMINWTEILIFVIGLVFSVCIQLVTKAILPWLKDKKLYDAAIVAVDAAEALFGRYKGEEKLQAALDMLADKGYDVKSAEVLHALKAAWKNLDMAMRLDGEKENEIPETEAEVQTEAPAEEENG